MLPDLADAVAAAYPVAYALLEYAAPDRTLFHVEHLVAMARIPALADRREELATLVQARARRDPGPRASWVHCLGLLGVDLRDLLTDADPAARLRAALTHQNDPRARDQILAALGAFRDPYSAHRPLTHAQRALLRALVANEQLWDPTNGSCANVFTRAGLPHHREACRHES
ncbi:hypothetical protein [Virgisporangium aurantiacum]|uniref:Uncharacterized protein n=1 Tax=Virgisporangium aurantiacum TaxID=175570 RepID=A0A8J3ZH95_9ACTN|nr:hypothetical protein [Virgisporangium aurantiacum]GIJ63796.1 hypothetical protein Vau01_113120 [Virgisporangium aurantiacum]